MVALHHTALTPFRYIDRLPRGTDRDIGGGYAMAMAAAGDTVPVAFPVLAPVGLATGTLQTAAFVAVPAFVSGVVAVRFVPADWRLAGPLAAPSPSSPRRGPPSRSVSWPGRCTSGPALDPV